MGWLDAIAGGFGSILDTITASENRSAQKEMAAQNIQLQKDFAQQGIRWKVEDAKAAGIHPLYAIGASGTSFSPVSIGNLPESDYATSFRNMGQDISRAVNATRTADEREDAFTKSAQALDLEGKKLDNDIKRASLASSVQRLKQTANPPLPDSLKMKEPEDVTQIYGGAGPWVHDKKISDAQEFENRYGEMSDWIMGPYVLWKDYVANYGARGDERRNLWDYINRYGKPPRAGMRASFQERFGKWRK